MEWIPPALYYSALYTNTQDQLSISHAVSGRLTLVGSGGVSWVCGEVCMCVSLCLNS